VTALPKNPMMFLCRLQDEHGNRVTYYGPYGAWGKNWHMVMRRVVEPRGGMAA
jgi:hypothetical protein